MIYNIASNTERILHGTWREDIIYECTTCEINYTFYLRPVEYAIKLRILQGRVAPEVKSRLYENTEVRYNNALFHIKRSTQLMKGLGSNLCRKIK